MSNQFLSFPSRRYLLEYYKHFGKENVALMEFLHWTYSFIGNRKRLIDIGSGPTIYQLISASRVIDEIICTDPLISNRNEVLGWLAKRPSAFNWDSYFRFVSTLERKEGFKISSKQIKARLMERVTSVLHYDVYSMDILSAQPEELFDVVSAHFCLESIAETTDELASGLRNIVHLLKQDGFLILSLLKNAEHYLIGNLQLPCFSINERLLMQLLSSYGLKLIRLETVTPEIQRGYEGFILCVSKKQK